MKNIIGFGIAVMLNGGLGAGIGQYVGELIGGIAIGQVVGSIVGIVFGIYMWICVHTLLQSPDSAYLYIWESMESYFTTGGSPYWDRIQDYNNRELGGLLGFLIAVRKGWILGLPIGAVIGWFQNQQANLLQHIFFLLIGGIVGVLGIGLIEMFIGIFIGLSGKPTNR